jgi:integrase
MAQTPRPWFRAATGWWMAQIDRKQVKLAKGKDKKTDAQKRLRELLTLRDKNPSPESGLLTVAAVIELFLDHAKMKYDPQTLYNRKLIYQDFAEAHGFRLVNDKDCLPYHLTSWLDAHKEWVSDWTKAHGIAVVHRPFNWAAKQRLIAANPFRGVTHRTGEPRRPMTDEEFEAVLKAADAGRRPAAGDRFPSGRKVCPSDLKRRVKLTAGERFRELLTFLRYTGARPGEASRLRWADVDLDEAVIRIKRHKTSKTQRVKKPRVIPLHPPAA